MKKRTLILVLICILGLSACRTLGSVIQEPVFSIKPVDLAGISFAGGVIKNDQAIRSKGVTVVDVPISLTYDGLYDFYGNSRLR